MFETYVIIGLLVVVIVLLAVILRQNHAMRQAEPEDYYDESERDRLLVLQSVRQLEQQHQAAMERLYRLISEEGVRNREGLQQDSRLSRGELQQSLHAFGQQTRQSLGDIQRTIGEGLEVNRSTVERKLGELQTQNEKKLEEMRRTVDEKLQDTLEKRLGQSFQQVSKQLEEVYKGLGEMQLLASSVGDLKKVLTNVKSRGTWGEVQLGAILEQFMSPEQYSRNAQVKPHSAERVDYALRMPGEGEAPLWLPIDAKFPVEDYQRLQAALEAGDGALAEEAAKQLETRIRFEARSIQEKYINPPNTTDFALLFVPVEGLYAEILRRPGLAEALQLDYHVIVAGPTILVALLNTLQVGFRTLAIQKRSGDIVKVLGAVQAEFGKFSVLLDKTQKKLQEASKSIDTAAQKSRTIERSLRKVELIEDEEELPLLEAAWEEEAE